MASRRRSGIFWYFDTLRPRGLALAKVGSKAIDRSLETSAQEVEDYMKANAPWKDNTGAARSGLVARATSSGFLGLQKSIVVAHTVDYGIWLEVKNSGEYAILLPTVEHFGPQVVANTGNFWSFL